MEGVILLNRYHLKITGEVQFVGFRYFAQITASNLSLTGWVRNCFDNSVEIEVQGNLENVKEFINELYRGNGFSSVDNIDAEKIDCKAHDKKFSIIY